VIRKVNFRDAVVVQLLYVLVSFPQDAVAEGWHSLLLRGVVLARPLVELIRWFKCNPALLELFKKHLLVPRRLLVCLVLLRGQHQVVFLQQLFNFVLFYSGQHFRPRKGVDSKIEVAHQEHLAVVFNRHTALRQVLGEGLLDNLGNLHVALVLPAPAADEVAVDGHDGLVVQFETDAHCSLVACGPV